MRILIVSNLYPPHYLGDYELLCYYTSEWLLERGHKVHVLTSSYKSKTALEERGVYRELELYIPFGQKASLSRGKRKRTYKVNYERTKERLKQIQPELVFVWSLLRLTAASVAAAQDGKYKIVFAINDDSLHSYVAAHRGEGVGQFLRYVIDRTFYRKITLLDIKFDHAVCISESLKSKLIKEDVPVENAKVIHQGLTVENFPIKKNFGRLNSPIRLFTFGQILEYKGIHLSITALNILMQECQESFHFYIIDNGDKNDTYLSRLHGYAQYLEISSNIHFISDISYEFSSQIFYDHDIFLFTSLRSEPLGAYHLEAMATGSPIISVKGGGSGEFLINEENCLIFDPNKERDLVRQIKWIVQDEELRMKIIRNARKMVETEFTVEKYVSEMEAFLEFVHQKK
ncbi:MAG: hypothetical protein B6244_06405 [Candidatus Cloacimonetes bacterium 4572_55]|nr:MAG: hypothetical protein B6244_06405 [Candidatus Cloacimonetes bacterium 4572_55]